MKSSGRNFNLEDRHGGGPAGFERAARRPKSRSVTPEPKIIAEHTVAAEETLSHLSLKYYGSAAKSHWMVIYEANKPTIGDNPGLIRAGMILKIPELPAALKSK